MELLYNQGLVGFGLFYGMVLAAGCLGMRQFRDRIFHLAGVLAVFVVSFGSVIYYNKMFWVMTAVMAATCLRRQAVDRVNSRNMLT